MIQRQALLISAPLCAGQANGNSELEATRNFLLSPRGGAWAAHEIQVLDNPGVEELTTVVEKMSADYTITYFSGRSFEDSDGNRFLVLGDDFIRETELLNQSPKQLVLVDTCPDTFSEEVIHFVGKPNEFALARKMYDRWIERCEPGQLIMHSGRMTSPAENKAGAFTKKLLQLCGSVPSVEDQFNLKSILAAGNEVPRLLRQEGLALAPEISYRAGNIKLPFAMAMPAPRPGLPEGQSQGGINAFSLAIFLLGLLLAPE